MLSGTSGGRRAPDENSLHECRHLVDILAGKTEKLFQECRLDKTKADAIRSMGSILAILQVHINRLDRDHRHTSSPEMLEDAHGFTYHSVRTCDLERISEK